MCEFKNGENVFELNVLHGPQVELVNDSKRGRFATDCDAICICLANELLLISSSSPFSLMLLTFTST